MRPRPPSDKPGEVLEQAVEDGVFPGCVAAAGSSSTLHFVIAAGSLDQTRESPVTPDTIYDLASLTKVIATTCTSLALHGQGRLDLDLPVRELVGDFETDEKRGITLRHLMAHASGLPAWKKLHGLGLSRAELVEEVIATPLQVAPGTRAIYSDLGAILWGECLARLTGWPLATLAWQEVFEPLSMRETLYRPPASLKTRIAPTEFDETYRGRLVHGEVHDENAHALGGVAGHAGLFSTAGDLARLARELLRGLQGGSSLFPAASIRLFTRRAGLVEGSSRALGWDTPSGRSSAGDLFSRSSFGHTGFTGTSIWIDPDADLFAILLSNRVHPTRANRKISGLRRRFHDAAYRQYGS